MNKKNANKTFYATKILKNKYVSKKLKLGLKTQQYAKR